MKTKWKEKEKKKKRSEEKKVLTRFELAPLSAPDESFTSRPREKHTQRVTEFLLLNPSSLIKHEFKDIFQKNDCSLDSENPT